MIAPTFRSRLAQPSSRWPIPGAVRPRPYQFVLLIMALKLDTVRMLSSMIHVGAWSLASSCPRAHRSTPPSTSRSDTFGESRK
jgi:hypothetical protein